MYIYIYHVLYIPLSVLLVLGPAVLVGAGELVIDSAEMVEEDSTASELVGSTVGSNELVEGSNELVEGSNELVIDSAEMVVGSIKLEVSSTVSVEEKSVEMIERVSESIVPDFDRKIPDKIIS